MELYTVGQVLFLIANNKVMPIQVVEEIIRTTLSGTEKSYIVLFPDKDKTQVDIKNVKGKLFTTQTDVRNHMIKNATNAINEMINTANEMSKLAFNQVKKESNEEINGYVKEEKESFVNKEATIKKIIEIPKEESKMQPEKNNNIITVDLGGGKIGKLSQENLQKVGVAK